MAEALPIQFSSAGFNFRLLDRNGEIALLAKQKGRICPSFEDVIIQSHPAERVFGHDLPEREVMPVSESWGTMGWSYGDLAGAKTRFKQLCNARRKGHSQPKGFTASASKGPSGPLAASSVQNAPTIP